MNYHKVKDPELYYQNLANRPRQKHCTSKYRGVGKGTHKHPWRAQVCWKGTRYFIGNFSDEIEAALAYNKAARLIIGDHAVLNEIDGYTKESP